MKLNDVLTLRRPLVGLDLETTGLTKRDRIIQVALELFVPDQPTGEYKTLVNPGIPIPPEATAVHGITDAMVADAPRFEELAANLASSLTACDFCGKNVKRFDLPFLQVEFKTAGIDWDWDGAAIIEVDRLWQLADPRRLGDAVKRWRDEQDLAELGELQAHDAMSDVRWATRVAANMAKECGMIGWSPAQVHEQLFPDAYDAAGKLKWLASGELAMTFGDWRDVPLSRVDAGFLRWILKKDFSEAVKTAVRLELSGHGPRKPNVSMGMRDL